VNVQVGIAVAEGGMGVEVGGRVGRGAGVSLGVGEWVVVGAKVGCGAFVALAGCAAMVGVAEGAVEDALSAARQLLANSKTMAVRNAVCLTQAGIYQLSCRMVVLLPTSAPPMTPSTVTATGL
jgi:hypothetical protein